MLLNYFKIAYRNIVRHRAFAFLNITGLAIGIASAILLYLVVSYEMSYNKSYEGYEDIYHIVTRNKRNGDEGLNAGVPYPALNALRNDFPGMKIGGLTATPGAQVSVLGKESGNDPEKKFLEETGTFFADPEFFDIMKHQWLAGNPSILAKPDVTVLTRSTAAKYFGKWELAMNQYLRLENAITVQVAGVLEDVPSNTDYPVRVVTSFITLKNYPDVYGYDEDWGSITSNYQLFVRLPEGRTPEQMEASLKTFIAKYNPPRPGNERALLLQPLADVHYDTRIESLGDHVTSKSTLWTLTLIGVFILVMACINFINLSTAQAVNRSKEIGIRKVLGGRKSALFLQMMGETTIIVFVALIVAFGLVQLALPMIRHVASIEETLSIFTGPVISFSLLLSLAVILLAGSYPALVMSGFRPMQALKNKISSASVAGYSLRRGLVILQFSISQVLIIGTIVAITQMNMVRKADMGFDKTAVLALEAPGDSAIHSRHNAFKQDLLDLPAVQSVSFSSDVPSSDNHWSNNFAFDHQDDADFNVFVKLADHDYFKTYGIRFVAGQGYPKSDTVTGFVINETLTKKLGVKNPQDAIGKEIRLGGSPWRPIVGVVRDFHTNSLREETKPILMASRRESYTVTSVKLNTNNFAKAESDVQQIWSRHYPAYANRPYFVDSSIDDFYRQENQLALLYKIFAAIAVVISCLGLYGLVSFMAVQRTREVGIRKTLGASAGNIVYLFSKEFTVLIIIAFVIAAPLAWYIMQGWLSNFVYRMSIGAWVFAVAVGASMIIAWLTVGYKSIKAARVNPVKSLRNE